MLKVLVLNGSCTATAFDLLFTSLLKFNLSAVAHPVKNHFLFNQVFW